MILLWKNSKFKEITSKKIDIGKRSESNSNGKIYGKFYDTYAYFVT